jgi:ribosomal protein S18 acetylase RimI-like enzyme
MPETISNVANARLQAATPAHLHELMAWFHDQQSCTIWGGPEFRYPFTPESFRADARYGESKSYALLDEDGTLLGFGQYYNRAGRCHLARLAIAPAHRGAGLGAVLIFGLCRLGCTELKVAECSLFVYPDNIPAMRLYGRLGFAAEIYPDASRPPDGCAYLVASAQRIFAQDSVHNNALAEHHE